jgi:hypothetical protein
MPGTLQRDMLSYAMTTVMLSLRKRASRRMLLTKGTFRPELGRQSIDDWVKRQSWATTYRLSSK